MSIQEGRAVCGCFVVALAISSLAFEQDPSVIRYVKPQMASYLDKC